MQRCTVRSKPSQQWSILMMNITICAYRKLVHSGMELRSMPHVLGGEYKIAARVVSLLIRKRCFT